VSILFFFFLFCYYTGVWFGLLLDFYERRLTFLLDLIPFFGILHLLRHVPVMLVGMWGEVKDKWGEMQ